MIGCDRRFANGVNSRLQSGDGMHYTALVRSIGSFPDLALREAPAMKRAKNELDGRTQAGRVFAAAVQWSGPAAARGARSVGTWPPLADPPVFGIDRPRPR